MPTNVLAYSREIQHPGGGAFSTPALVPSFSSKGFGFQTRKTQTGEKEESEVADIYAAASEFLTDSMLVSAFDIYHGYLPSIDHAITEITFLDSGGYETSDQQDLSCTFTHFTSNGVWDPAKHAEVLGRWPAQVPAVFINYDSPRVRVPLSTQIETARALFSSHRNQLTCLLVKPETSEQRYVQVEGVQALARELRYFDVIGFTEKELGNSTLKRMESIARIRLALNDAGVEKPIHIFGCLDPITVPLYFMAGAEIFDGLTWLRFGFDESAATYRQNYAAKHIGIDQRDDFVKLKTMQDNLSYLRKLTNQMRRFLIDGDFGKFGANAQIIRDGVDLLRTRNKRV